MKSVIGIDPGSKQSAFVWWTGKSILEKGYHPNENILRVLQTIQSIPSHDPVLAIESMVTIPGGAGKSIIQTIEWADRFYQAWQGEKAKVPVYIIRKALGAKNDQEIRAVLIQRFGADLCHGLRGKGYHLYRAFAVCVYYMDHLNFQERILKG